MVALVFKKDISKKILSIAKYLAGEYLRQSLKYTWMEVSEVAERFVMKYGEKFYKISNDMAKKLLNKTIKICNDKYYYIRNV